MSCPAGWFAIEDAHASRSGALRAQASRLAHLPDVDVAAAGGWKGPHTMKVSYQQADPDTMLRVVLEAAELREA
jgi:hypothetical protein